MVRGPVASPPIAGLRVRQSVCFYSLQGQLRCSSFRSPTSSRATKVWARSAAKGDRRALKNLTRVDLETLEIDGHIPLDGFDGPPNASEAPGEGGFGDAQIDASGMLYAAHSATGRVLVYDTVAREKRAELEKGGRAKETAAK